MSVETAPDTVELGRPIHFSGSRPRQWAIAALYATLVAVALYPVLTTALPPLVDYPNHLARAHILAELDANAVLAARYAANWSVIPNLAMDVVLLFLMQFMSVADAGRLFVAMSLVLPVAGVAALRRVLYGHVGLLPAVSVLFLYNHVFAWGFLSYLFAAGLYLLAFAGWLATARWPAMARVCVFSLVSIALFFAHIFALGLFGLSVMSHELWRCACRRPLALKSVAARLTVAGAPFVLPAAFWLLSAVGQGGGLTDYGSWQHKVRVLLSPVLFHGQALDFQIFVFALLVLVVGILARKIGIAPQMRLPLLVLGVAAIIMPNWLLGGWGVDFRLPPVLVFLALAAMEFKISRRVAGGCAIVALYLLVSRVATVQDAWHDFDRQMAELRTAFSVIERGSRVITHQDERAPGAEIPRIMPQAYWNAAALAVIDRDVFIPILFTDPKKQPLAATPAYREIDTPYGRPMPVDQLHEGADPAIADILAGTIDEKGRHRYWANWPSRFDYLLSFHFGAGGNPLPGVLEQMHEGSFFALYRIRRQDIAMEGLPDDKTSRETMGGPKALPKP